MKKPIAPLERMTFKKLNDDFKAKYPNGLITKSNTSSVYVHFNNSGKCYKYWYKSLLGLYLELNIDEDLNKQFEQYHKDLKSYEDWTYKHHMENDEFGLY